MIKTILVPTDGSEHAKKAIDLAADIAGKYDARLVVVHVLLRHSSESELEALCKEIAMPDSLEKKFEDIRQQFVEMVSSAYEPGYISVIVPDDLLNEVGDLILDNARLRAESNGAKDITTQILDGAPADMILATAEKEDANLIVMGSRGLGNIAGLLVGSVSHKVSHLSSCTCVTVK